MTGKSWQKLAVAGLVLMSGGDVGMALAYCETETQAYCTMGKKTYDSITASLCKETIERFNYQVDESKKSYQESPASAERGIMQVIKEFEDEARRVLAGACPEFCVNGV